MQKKLNFFLICPLRPGGGGLNALTDMSAAKNVSFFGTAPLMKQDHNPWAVSNRISAAILDLLKSILRQANKLARNFTRVVKFK